MGELSGRFRRHEQASGVLVAAIQLEASGSSSAPLVAAGLLPAMSVARDRGARLAVLPAYIGLSLLPAMVQPAPSSWQELGQALPALAPLLGPAWASLGAELARKTRLLLLAGTTLVVDHDGLLRHRAYLFSADGRPLGWQDQTHLGARERALGVVPGDTLEPIVTPYGKLGIVVGDDVLVPEVSAILVAQGASILLHPTAVTSFSPAEWQRRLWREVQSQLVFGLEAPLIGRLLGEQFAGRATVHAPNDLTSGGLGVLAQAADEHEEAVVLATLDEQRRYDLLMHSRVAVQRNAEFYSNAL